MALAEIGREVVDTNLAVLKPGDKGHSLLSGLEQQIGAQVEVRRESEIALPDGTYIAFDDGVFRARLRLSKPGTRFSFVNLGKALDLKRANSAAVLSKLKSTETIGVWHPELGMGEGGMRVRIEEPSKGMWGKIMLGDREVDEKTLAVGILTDIYDPNKGIEGEALLTVALLPQDVVKAADSLSGVACKATHDGRPDYGSTKSLQALASVKGARLLRFGLEKNVNRLVRFRLDDSGNLRSLSDADLVGEQALERQTRQLLGLLKLTQVVAETNPTSMGSGTAGTTVLAAISESIPLLIQRAGNDDSLGAFRSDFAKKLGVIKYGS